MDVLHVALEVADLDRAVAFYEEALGLEHSRDYAVRGTKNYYLSGSGPAEIQLREVDERPDPAGIDHVAVATDDVDATVETAVEEFDASLVRGPDTLERVNRRLAVITGPEGYTVHLLEEL